MLQSCIYLILLVLECLCYVCVAERKVSVLKTHLLKRPELLLIAGKYSL